MACSGAARRCGTAEAGVRGALLAIRINTPQAGNTFETPLSPSLNHRVTSSSRFTHNFAPENRNQPKKYEDGKKSINDGGHGRKCVDHRMGGDRGRSRPRGSDRAHHRQRETGAPGRIGDGRRPAHGRYNRHQRLLQTAGAEARHVHLEDFLRGICAHNQEDNRYRQEVAGQRLRHERGPRPQGDRGARGLHRPATRPADAEERHGPDQRSVGRPGREVPRLKHRRRAQAHQRHQRAVRPGRGTLRAGARHERRPHLSDRQRQPPAIGRGRHPQRAARPHTF